MAEEDIVLTYETIYDVLMKEKRSNELQKLDEHFLTNVLEYLKEKSKLFQGGQDTFFGAEEQRKAFQQLDNARKLLREIYDWREKKILLLARDASRTSDHLVNKSAMLQNERIVFEEVLSLLKRNRSNVLDNLVNLKVPDMIELANFSDSAPFFSGISKNPDLDLKDSGFSESSHTSQESKPLKSEDPKPEIDNIRVKFTTDVSQFVGPEMESFGPFSPGDEADLPEIVANIIINKGQGEKL
jgi:DNA replication initiation complex subunit (GINS family)